MQIEELPWEGRSMAKTEIASGICGHTATVEATKEGKVCKLTITSDCQAIQNLAKDLTEVDPYQEISCKRAIPQTLQMGQKHCFHAACPVPVGIIKAIEVASGLALPKDATIKVTK